MKQPWYMGVYVTDDMKSRKECQAVLAYGLPNWKDGNPTTENTHDFKYVELPCPTCCFTHSFKRSEWTEGLEWDTMGSYKRDEAHDATV